MLRKDRHAPANRVERATLFVLAGGLPAGADIDHNPNAVYFSVIQCPEIGLVIEAGISPTLQSVTGHDTAGNIVGVATSVYATDAAGNRLFPLFDRPGAGLDANTVWCWWEDDPSPTGYAGGGILFRGPMRP